MALFSYNALEIGVFGLLGIGAHDTFADVPASTCPGRVGAAGLAVIWFLGFRSIDVGAKVLAVAGHGRDGGLLVLLAVAVLCEAERTGSVSTRSTRPTS